MRIFVSILCCSSVALALGSSTLVAEEPLSLAQQSKQILETHCADCHGAFGSREGGFGDVLAFDTLIGSRVVPGQPNDSTLWQRMGLLKDMPPEESVGQEDIPTEAELQIVRQWILSLKGKPVVEPTGKVDVPATRPFVSMKEELREIDAYLSKQDREDHRLIRFFSIRHLHNMPVELVRDEDLRVYRAAVSKLVNSLTWAVDPVIPDMIGQHQTTLAVNLKDLEWNKAGIWQEILKVYPYGLSHEVLPNDNETRDLAEDISRRTGVKVFNLRADWFVATASRPPLYHTLLQLPQTATELERQLDVNVSENFQERRLARGGFTESGVSGHNRLLERHSFSHGYYWKSYDFKSSAGLGNLFVFPLGPRFEGNPFQQNAFKHDGGEIIYSLPNGMQGYFLVDGKDERIDEGPIDVVADLKKTSGTPLVVNGLSCMACHRSGMIDFVDTIRQGQILGGRLRDVVDRLYPEKTEMDKLVAQDRKRFLTTLQTVTGPYLQIGVDKEKPIEAFPEPISAIAKWYLLQELSAEEASRELGLKTADDLVNLLKNNRRLQVLGLYPLARRQTIKREVWENTDFIFSPFQKVAEELQVGTPEVFR